MRIEQQPAYVLHARPYRETSLLLECITRDYGRVGVVARGVRGERARLKRAQMEPFQPLALGLLLRGEMATMTAIEVIGMPIRLPGDAGLAGLYLNELVVRLTGRQDPLPTLFDAYAVTVSRLCAGESLGWSLRRFERDLLQAIGYGLPLQHEGDTGEPLQAQASYRFMAEQGAVRCAPTHPQAVRGSDLQALEQDRMPDNQGLKTLRDMMREVIRFHLGGADLRAWRVLTMAVSGRRPTSDTDVPGQSPA
jgi:DNA repair protein RecO (recombination protein O)